MIASFCALDQLLSPPTYTRNDMMMIRLTATKPASATITTTIGRMPSAGLQGQT